MLIVYENALDYILKMQERAALSGRDIKYIVISESELREIQEGELRNMQGPFKAKDGVYGTIFGTLLVTTDYHLAQLKSGEGFL